MTIRDDRPDARQLVGVTAFVDDCIHAMPCTPALIPLAGLLWVFRRQTIIRPFWPLPLPSTCVQALVIHYHRIRDGANWKQCSIIGTTENVVLSIRELMVRAPWALYGYTDEARAAMSNERRFDTTREIASRCERAKGAPAGPPIDWQRLGPALRAERVYSDWRGGGPGRD